jgi:aspartate/methionine/tyrosine aminotransferase
MSGNSRVLGSTYLDWAKRTPHPRLSLATSGLASLPLSALPVQLADLELSGPPGDGYAPLVHAIAAHAGVAPDRVVTATGTSMANYLAMAALLAPGDEVLIERPTYEPLLAVARYLGATVTRFERAAERAFAVEPAAIAAALTPRTRLLVLTNLHNPSGVLTDAATLARVGELLRGVGARVLVDEVYLDAVFDETARSAAHLGPTFVVTNSLTKVYGLSGLRCGWILAEPEVARRIWALGDLHENHSPHLTQRLGVIAFAELSRLRVRAQALLQANRALLSAFFDERPELDVVRPPHGTIAFPRLVGGDVDRLCTILRERYDCEVVPGSMFERADHFRVGVGGDRDSVREGLRRLGAALDDLRR